MKTTFVILALTTVLFASYTVEKSSITVGYCTGDANEAAALANTVLLLGFNAYQSSLLTAADFASHHCQVVFGYNGSSAVTGWSAEMTGPGRGYIQVCNFGWGFFNCSRSTIDEGTLVTVSNISQSHELTTFPFVIPATWNLTHGLCVYSHPNQDYLANCSEGTVPVLGATAGDGVNCAKALTAKYNGIGRGVWYAWCNYGNSSTLNDRHLTENAIIYAAQPPKADAGGPYTGYVDNPVTLDASASTDNGSITNYEWDINGDGSYDFAVTTPITTYTWTAPYTGIIRVRCTDNIFGKSYSETTATIIGNSDVRDTSIGVIKSKYQ